MGGRRLDKFYDILQHSLHIAGYVQEICLVVKDNDSWVAGLLGTPNLNGSWITLLEIECSPGFILMDTYQAANL